MLNVKEKIPIIFCGWHRFELSHKLRWVCFLQYSIKLIVKHWMVFWIKEMVKWNMKKKCIFKIWKFGLSIYQIILFILLFNISITGMAIPVLSSLIIHTTKSRNKTTAFTHEENANHYCDALKRNIQFYLYTKLSIGVTVQYLPLM